ncbi:DUF551 domain-containing protein [Serratia proteamaculans]|uniref:DUF551 domain-containing protein n=1 Tax=Serratia proteamaculans TaxID=28151 RepID=UPI0039BDD5E1
MDKLRSGFEDAWVTDNSSTPEEADIRREALKRNWLINESGEGAYFDSFVMWAWKWWQASRANSPEIPDGWVACSERMPLDSQTVLCHNLLVDLSGIPFIADYVKAFETYDGKKFETGFYIGRALQAVTHWQSLPPPPTTEK